MNAYVLERFDSAPVFLDVPKPSIGEGEVLVRVQATSVNPFDDLVQRGVFRERLEYRFPAVFGRDVAGVVEATGAGVERLQAGDEVFGFVKRDYVGNGTFAEYVAVTDDRFVRHRPKGLGLEEAGALGLASVTALQCLDTVQAGAGTTLFVNGATGGVGSFAVQIARARGVDVIATARPGPEEEHVRRLGVEHVVDWSAGDVGAAVRATFPDGVDAMVDLISQRDTIAELATHVLAPGGRGATTRFDDPPQVEGGRTLQMVHSTPELELLDRVAELVEAGDVVVPITARYAFHELPDAFARLREGAIGKIAVGGAGA